ncbi:hypothetical protein BN1058_02587 [Paraliobacillus sp. PM-2]|nr:hypothetical protein BN1058_02587 [Paraliobacillus sp. PM-2]
MWIGIFIFGLLYLLMGFIIATDRMKQSKLGQVMNCIVLSLSFFTISYFMYLIP